MNLICRVQFNGSAAEAGGQLEGRLRLLENSTSVAKANKLRLREICRVTGPGEPEFRVLNTAELPGPFKAQTDIPFRIPIPGQGPITYQGIILQLSWHLSVELLVPGGVLAQVRDGLPGGTGAALLGAPRCPEGAPDTALALV